MNDRRFLLALCAIALIPGAVGAQLRDITVAAPTRLDWVFASQGFGAAAGKLPATYDSAKQRYQLFVPKDDKKESRPLIVFISAGDTPAGWNAWKPVCEKHGVLFCSPYAAGNNVPASQRTRVILDMLDDVRRHHRIDPEQTYISGFSGGGRMACALGLSLPEVFAGIVPICGTNPLTKPDYLRHRAQDRLSVAFVTGETDFNRKEVETYMAPWFEELGIRSKAWVAPGVGHALPSSEVLAEVYAWLKDDLPRRRQDAKARPGLVFAAEQTPTGAEQAKHFFETARNNLKDADRTWHGVVLLQGIVARWGKTPAAAEARKLLKEVGNDEKLLQRIGDQGAEDEIKTITAQAKALERFGQVAAAIEAWSILAKNYQGAPPGQTAQENIRRLKGKSS